MQKKTSAPDIDSHKAGLPRHLAIIMDGNNRWAREKDLPGHEGHRAGEATVQLTIQWCAEQGIEVVTLFAFSSENWRRPQEEVNHLMALFLRALDKRVEELHEKNIRIRFIGERSAFDNELQQGMERAEKLTCSNSRMSVVIAVNYGGQWDIIEAAWQAAQLHKESPLSRDEFDQAFTEHLSMHDVPPVDLLIRTGNEKRISNFLLWQLAYAEFYFSPLLWPDFDEQALAEAVQDYAGRQRRFGRSGEDSLVHQARKES